MRRRCYDPNRRQFGNYGGRGIKVCDQWRNSFETFLKDMGRKPSPKHSLDRIDPNGDYEPSNCKWATPHEQANNKTSNRWIDAFGKRMTLGQWSKETGVPDRTISIRIRHLGWAPERAVMEPVARRT
jgi:hypothetical protein